MSTHLSVYICARNSCTEEFWGMELANCHLWFRCTTTEECVCDCVCVCVCQPARVYLDIYVCGVKYAHTIIPCTLPGTERKVNIHRHKETFHREEGSREGGELKLNNLKHFLLLLQMNWQGSVSCMSACMIWSLAPTERESSPPCPPRPSHLRCSTMRMHWIGMPHRS